MICLFFCKYIQVSHPVQTPVACLTLLKCCPQSPVRNDTNKRNKLFLAGF